MYKTHQVVLVVSLEYWYIHITGTSTRTFPSERLTVTLRPPTSEIRICIQVLYPGTWYVLHAPRSTPPRLMSRDLNSVLEYSEYVSITCTCTSTSFYYQDWFSNKTVKAHRFRHSDLMSSLAGSKSHRRSELLTHMSHFDVWR